MKLTVNGKELKRILKNVREDSLNESSGEYDKEEGYWSRTLLWLLELERIKVDTAFVKNKRREIIQEIVGHYFPNPSEELERKLLWELLEVWFKKNSVAKTMEEFTDTATLFEEINKVVVLYRVKE